MAEKQKILIVRKEDRLTVAPDAPELHKVLSYIKKEIVVDPKTFGRKISRKNQSVYRIDQKNGIDILATFPGFYERVIETLKTGNYTVWMKDMRLKLAPPNLSLMSGFRFSQRELLEQALSKEESGLIGAPTRYGKCFGKGTKVKMYPTGVKNVEDIVNGDQVMGPDFRKRTVTGVTQGSQEMCRIVPIDDEDAVPWTCNMDHLLYISVLPSGSKKELQASPYEVVVPVKEWLEWPLSRRLRSRIIRLDPKNDFKARRIGFNVWTLPVGDYYGFELLGYDKLFLLADGQIVHNTTLIINTLRAYPKLCTVVTAPGEDLVKQLYEDIKSSLPHREVKMLGAGSKTRIPSEDITVCSMDSLDKCDFGRTRLVLIDEPHAAVTNTRLPAINKFTQARRIGYGATLKGRFDNRDILIEGLIGPVLAERTFQEAVAEGAICQIVVFCLVVPLSDKELFVGSNISRDAAYKKILFQNDRVGRIIYQICENVLPKDWQTLIFIKNEKQAEFLLDHVGSEGTIAMAKRLTAKKRAELMQQMIASAIKRCLASDIYSQGVTFSQLRAVINAGGGGANTTTVQKPGRLAEIIEGKKCGVMFDIIFEKQTPGVKCPAAVNMIMNDCHKRLEAYKEKSYEIVMAKSIKHLKEEFNARCI